MSEPKVLMIAELTPEHKTTRRTTHTVAGQSMPKPSSLRIVSYDPSRGYYLFYCDAGGREMTDTFHGSIDEAMDQASFEFGVDRSAWKASSSVVSAVAPNSRTT